MKINFPLTCGECYYVFPSTVPTPPSPSEEKVPSLLMVVSATIKLDDLVISKNLTDLELQKTTLKSAFQKFLPKGSFISGITLEYITSKKKRKQKGKITIEASKREDCEKSNVCFPQEKVNSFENDVVQSFTPIIVTNNS